MKGDTGSHFTKVAVILALSAFLLFVGASYVWARQPMDATLNEAVTILLALVATSELGLALFFFRKGGQ